MVKTISYRYKVNLALQRRLTDSEKVKRIPGSSSSSWHISEDLTGMSAGGTGYSSLTGVLTDLDDAMGSADDATRPDNFVCFSARQAKKCRHGLWCR